MAKTITLKISPQIIADFQSCFNKKEDEKSYLYQEIIKTINESVGNVFVNKMCSVNVIENGKKIKKFITLDEINFYKIEIKSNVSWETKDIAGELVSYEYVVGDNLWDKINNYAKLFFITNKIHNESIITDLNTSFEKLKLDNKMTIQQIKKTEDIIKTQESQMSELVTQDCLEAYIHTLITKPMFDKIIVSQNIILDKEFKELNRSPEKLNRSPEIEN